MPLRIGNTGISAIYKGTTPIGKIYKGTTLLYESASWLPYSYNYLYYGLVPTTIDSKNVKNKAKVDTIYGNSEVVNQLVQDGNFTDTSNWYGENGTISVSNNILTYTYTTTATSFATNRIEQSWRDIVVGHKYLVDVSIKCPYDTTIRLYLGGWQVLGTALANKWTRLTALITPENTNANNHIYFDIYSQSSYQLNDTIQVKEYMKIDLTQAYPFDIPSALTDNRIVNILNGGYRDYNLGEIKSVDIGEIASQGFNIWNEVWEIGGLNTSTGQNDTNTNRIRSTNYISVIPNFTYYFRSATGTFVVCFYDKNKNYLGYDEPITTLTMSSECYYIRFRMSVPYGTTYNNDICINVSSSLNGTYKKYENPDNITLKYQGAGINDKHNTFEITDSGYVFTRNVFERAYQSGDENDSTVLTDLTNTLYVLTTPQTITIPKKHLASVDLGSLTPYVLSAGTSNERVYIPFNLAKTPADSSTNANIYCEKYMTSNVDSVYSHTSNNIISIHNTNGAIYIYSSEFIGLSASQIQTKLNGILLFYETNTEVADIKSIGIQSGGTLTSNFKRLPSEYQEVEYIESSGTQYINTGYKPTSEVMTFNFKLKLPSSIQGLSLFGSNSSSLYSLVPYHSDSYGTRTFKHWFGTSGNLFSITYNETSKVQYYMNNGAIQCNVDGVSSSSSYAGSIQCGYNIYIFGKNDNGISNERANGYTLYYFKIYDNNVLVRDFVPCYRKSDNVIGLYDLVNGTFYTNAGTGTFAKGKDITTSEVLPNVKFEVKCK